MKHAARLTPRLLTAGPLRRVLTSLFALWLGVGIASVGWAQAPEDPEVAKARAQLRQQYEAEKAARAAEEARVKAAAQRRALALLRQGVVAIYNPTSGPINYSVQWYLWDGTYTAWSKMRLEGRKSLLYAMPGGLKLMIKFNSSGGGDKSYGLMSAQIPSEVRASFSDAMPNKFAWGTRNDLDLYRGKPQGW